VITPQQLDRYLGEEAQPWEALSYTKLRFVAGREDLKPVTLAPVWHRIVEIGAQPGFAADVREMRSRLEKANRFAHSFKLARGGFYDIDFIASYLMLREASLASGNILDRLQHLQQAGTLNPATSAELEQAAILYRTADHVIRLVTGRARPELPEAEHARGAVEGLVGEILKTAKPGNLQDWLQETAETMRRIFESLVT
jgi:glutamine synthetase adenylyltransferase